MKVPMNNISPVRIYYVYAPTERDKALLCEMESHLKALEYAGRMESWHRGKICAGSAYDHECLVQLEKAQLLLLLISPDFFASPQVYEIEMKQALVRQSRGEVYVIPILLRPVYYDDAPFAQLEMLPSNGKPITSWTHRDEAFADVAYGLSRILNFFSVNQRNTPSVLIPSPERGTRYETIVYGSVRDLIIGDHSTKTIFFTR
jgi:hypothetical protein